MYIINKEVIDKLSMENLRKAFYGLCGERLSLRIGEIEARNIIIARSISMNK